MRRAPGMAMSVKLSAKDRWYGNELWLPNRSCDAIFWCREYIICYRGFAEFRHLYWDSLIWLYCIDLFCSEGRLYEDPDPPLAYLASMWKWCSKIRRRWVSCKQMTCCWYSVIKRWSSEVSKVTINILLHAQDSAHCFI